jgi:hypothetical protein
MYFNIIRENNLKSNKAAQKFYICAYTLLKHECCLRKYIYVKVEEIVSIYNSYEKRVKTIFLWGNFYAETFRENDSCYFNVEVGPVRRFCH